MKNKHVFEKQSNKNKIDTCKSNKEMEALFH